MATLKDLYDKLMELKKLKEELKLKISDAYNNVIYVETVYEFEKVRFYVTAEHCQLIIPIEEMRKLGEWLRNIGALEEDQNTLLVIRRTETGLEMSMAKFYDIETEELEKMREWLEETLQEIEEELEERREYEGEEECDGRGS